MNSIVFAAIIAAAAAPVANARPEPTRGSPPAAIPAQAESPAVRSKQVRYCVMGTMTSSRIARKTCRTRDEWLANGFDPLAAGR
ncbi:MAG TPA: hypothetical protein VF592_07335 [Sphingomonas sp.]|uniref:hypothetical protein n=1 Tax=Sphingomonas sp. TaxID=28214 RepID=UPI002ED8BB18